jgi:Flp pilus assembly protein TadG
MIFVIWTRQQLLKTVRFLFLLILLAALILGVYGVVRTGEVMAQRSRDSSVSEKGSAAAARSITDREKPDHQNLFDKLIKKLKGYHRGDF